MIGTYRTLERAAATAIALGATLAPTLGASEMPRGVSPGSLMVASLLVNSCPTFSWTGSDSAIGYDLVVYQVRSDGSFSASIQTNVVGDARAWTPSADQCPASGGQYAWAVRALTEDGPGPWSELLLFETAGMPSDDEVRRALNTLRRYRQGREGDVREGLTPSLAGTGNPPTSGTEARRYPGLGLEGSASALRSPTVDSYPAPQAVTVPGSYSLSLSGDMALNGAMFKDGAPFLHNDGGTVTENTAVGWKALINVTPGIPYPFYGYRNTAVGQGALLAATSGTQNTALGAYALTHTTEGFFNTALGHRALFNNQTGISNTAVGDRALYSNTVGGANVAVGNYAMRDNISGNGNTALGWRAGRDWADGSYNIAIGSQVLGSTLDSGTIRIGGDDRQSRTFIEGIRGATSSNYFPFNEAICTNEFEQLGPCTPSSLRFKQDVSDMEDTTGLLDQLRPVTFQFKPSDGVEAKTPTQYGLIAEEVADVLPTLVSYDDNGKPYTVRYALLTPLLLAEVQRQAGEIADLRTRAEEAEELTEQVAELRRTVNELRRTKGLGEEVIRNHLTHRRLVAAAIALGSLQGSDLSADDPPRGMSPGSLTTAQDPPLRTSDDLDPALRSGTQALSTATVGASPSPAAVTAPGSFSLNLSGDLGLGGSVFQDEVPFIHNYGGAAYFNTAVGLNALVDVTPGLPDENYGKFNSAFGQYALYENTAGSFNTASGGSALQFNTTGFNNSASGFLALLLNKTGSRNTATGSEALRSNTTGSASTAIGDRALANQMSGFGNTAIGTYAMLYNDLGGSNTAVGINSGRYWSSGSHNIALGGGAYGSSSDSGVIRIGGEDRQSLTFIEGISGTGVSGNQVFITSDDQLGIATSSVRFKHDIRDIQGVRDKLLDLRPVSFRYKDESAESPEGGDSNPIEYGLIAEEVAEVFPELVINDEDGKPFTVRYHLLTPMLLAELQRQQEEIADLRRAMHDLRASARWKPPRMCTERRPVRRKERP